MSEKEQFDAKASNGILSLRFVSLWFMVLALFVSVLIVYLSARIFYESLSAQVIQERIVLMKMIGASVTSYTQEAQNIDGYTSQTRTLFSSIAENERGLAFVRLIRVSDGTIILSADSREEYSNIQLPAYLRGEIITGYRRVHGGTVLDVTYGISDDLVLWSGINNAFLTNPAIVLAVQLAFLTTALFFGLGLFLYISSNMYLIMPIQKLQRSLERVSIGDYTARLPEGPQNEFALIFSSFNHMIDAVQDARKHDTEVAQMKTDFIAIAAHQLRTPLSAVRWALELVLEDGGQNLTTKQRHVLQRGHESTLHIVQLVNDLLSVDRIEHEVTDIRHAQADICHILASVVDKAQLEAVQRSITIQQEYELKDCVEVWADPDRLGVALGNIMDNALRYTQNGGVITLDLGTSKGFLYIRISDTGIGIPEEYHDKLFTKFYRAPNAVRHAPNGSGLGLYMARQIIRRHGGTVKIASTEGRGTAVTIRLPISDTQLA